MNTLIDLLNESETREDDENYKNPVDMLFEDLEKRNPEHFAVRQYKKYKLAAGVTTYIRHLNQLHEPLIVYLLRLLCLQAYKYD